MERQKTDNQLVMCGAVKEISKIYVAVGKNHCLRHLEKYQAMGRLHLLFEQRVDN